jgi:hypothetical protein
MRKAQKNDSPRENCIEGVSAARIKNPAALSCMFWPGIAGSLKFVLRTETSCLPAGATLLLAPDAFAPCCFFSRRGKLADAPESLRND